jgi:PST family polysaccharide transporter
MASIRKEFFSGVFYTAIAKYSGIIISIVVTAILARIISPESFGVVAIATIFINFFSTLTTVGISPAIVQNKSIDDQEIKSINSFTFLLATIITLVYLAAIPIIVKFYDSSELKLIMMLLSINVFFSIATTVPNAILLKEKDFKFISIRTFLVQFFLGVVSVLAALGGMGIYSLLINPVVGSIVLFIINFVKKPISFGKITKIAVDKILGFSVFQSLFNLVYLLYRNVDKLYIGKAFSMTDLGYYEKSYRLMMLPLDNIASVISPVLHPILSNYQNDKNTIWSFYLKSIKTLGEFSFLISVILYFFAKPIIVIIYGAKWEPAIPIFQILSLSICFQLLQAPIGAIFQSINQVKSLLYSSIWQFVFISVLLLLSGQTGDIKIVSYSIVIAFALGFLTYQIYLVKFFGQSFLCILKLIMPDVIISIVLFIILFVANSFVVTNSLLTYLLLNTVVIIVFIVLLLCTGMMPNMKELLLSGFNKIINKK